MNRAPRIVVVGSSCAGKSTFAQALAQARGCPHIELDALFWDPHWQPKPTETFRRLVDEASRGQAWVADGNYGGVRDLLWPRASTIVWLDYSFPRVLWRALKRTVVRCVSREPLWHGNRESVWRSFFTKDSILVWVATTFHRRRREFAALRASGRFEHLAWVELRDPRQAEKWLADERAMLGHDRRTET